VGGGPACEGWPLLKRGSVIGIFWPSLRRPWVQSDLGFSKINSSKHKSTKTLQKNGPIWRYQNQFFSSFFLVQSDLGPSVKGGHKGPSGRGLKDPCSHMVVVGGQYKM
jgi:hypothetical protein